MNNTRTSSTWKRPDAIVLVAAATFLVAGIVLAGWFFDIEPLRQLVPGQVSMKANTALGFLICSSILYLSQLGDSRARKALCIALEAALLALAVATLAQYIFGLHFNIDQMLVRATQDTFLTSAPGRMAPTTAIGFILFAAAVIADHWRTGIGRGLSRTLATVLLLLALASLLGYAYGAPELYLGIDGYTATSLPSAILFLLLAIGAIGLRPDYGFTAMLREKTVVGTYIRSLLPIVVAVPLLVGAMVALGYGRLYDGRFAIALTALGSVIAAAMMSVISIIIIRRADDALYVRDRALFATTSAVVITDHAKPDEPIVFINEAFTKITGYTEEDCLGRNCRFLNNRADVSKKTLADIRACLQANTAGTFELENRRKDGGIFWNRLNLSPVRNYEGRVSHYIGVVDDVTARLEQQAKLESALDETRKANQLRETFVRQVSHELRTPLNAALTWIRLMELDKSEETVTRGMSVVANSIASQSRLIEDLVDVSRFASAGVRLESESVDACELIVETVEEMRPAIEPDQSLETIVGPGNYVAKVDPLRVKQIVRNLLSNANRYTPTGGHITVRLSVTSEDFVLEVADNGKGLSAEEVASLFEPFWRADHDLPGLGVGLSIVSSLVTAHNGTIDVKSAGRNEGSTFTVRLPLDAAPSGRAALQNTKSNNAAV
jgi:PAS domain S-box-containing protein